MPLGRIGKAEEFASLALLLASEQGGFISGTAVDCTRRRSGDGIFTCERGDFARRLD